ncbi:MAG: hypothetical protein IJS65_01990 [Clostridia bacterium]|nr:hypothetical protein [Clostridia bacterium]
MTRKEIKEKARQQLGMQIFGDTWLWAVLVAFIFSLIVSAAGTILPAIGILIIIGPLRYGFKTMFLKQARDGE